MDRGAIFLRWGQWSRGQLGAWEDVEFSLGYADPEDVSFLRTRIFSVHSPLPDTQTSYTL